MKNLHLIPTEKPSRLYKSKITQNIFICNIISQHGDATYNQHIYITSDEEIKEGDWGLSKLNEIILFGRSYNEKFYKKIILTTDQDLIADGVQSIDDEFLEWFVKNPTCEYVEVKHFGTCCGNQSITQCINCEKYNPIYKNIIPQEESKQDPTLENSKLALREYILANKEKVTEDLQEMREKSSNGRDETLEEAAERLYPFNPYSIGNGIKYDEYAKERRCFIEGANYQADKMYSEEDLLSAFEAGMMFIGEDKGSFREWFEQFKKK
jgi:hypothetical protein